MESQDLKPLTGKVWKAGSHAWQIEQGNPLVMGIVNVTPDSFSDGGKHNQWQQAVAHGKVLASEGADILDVGGESTRPGSAPVTEAEEWRRIEPVIKSLVDEGYAVSVDTMKAGIMEKALNAGACILNDVNGFRTEGALDLLAGSNAGAVVMHMLGEPKSMQVDPHYLNVTEDVHLFLASRLSEMEKMNIEPCRILVDPGFGFGKTLEHNQLLFRHIPQFSKLGAGVFIGVSRKRMIGEVTGVDQPDQRVHGSVAAAMLAARMGAAVLRVHDVKATVDALKVQRWVG